MAGNGAGNNHQGSPPPPPPPPPPPRFGVVAQPASGPGTLPPISGPFRPGSPAVLTAPQPPSGPGAAPSAPRPPLAIHSAQPPVGSYYNRIVQPQGAPGPVGPPSSVARPSPHQQPSAVQQTSAGQKRPPPPAQPTQQPQQQQPQQPQQPTPQQQPQQQQQFGRPPGAFPEVMDQPQQSHQDQARQQQPSQQQAPLSYAMHPAQQQHGPQPASQHLSSQPVPSQQLPSHQGHAHSFPSHRQQPPSHSHSHKMQPPTNQPPLASVTPDHWAKNASAHGTQKLSPPGPPSQSPPFVRTAPSESRYSFQNGPNESKRFRPNEPQPPPSSKNPSPSTLPIGAASKKGRNTDGLPSRAEHAASPPPTHQSSVQGPGPISQTQQPKRQSSSGPAPPQASVYRVSRPVPVSRPPSGSQGGIVNFSTGAYHDDGQQAQHQPGAGSVQQSQQSVPSAQQPQRSQNTGPLSVAPPPPIKPQQTSSSQTPGHQQPPQSQQQQQPQSQPGKPLNQGPQLAPPSQQQPQQQGPMQSTQQPQSQPQPTGQAPQPSTAQPTTSIQQAQQQQVPIPPPQQGPVPMIAYRQLKVEDALAYLEQVKTQFASRPQVYNHFLDIMKDFKSQTIDTTEVIRRVSHLFRGHKNLILGFNTFLPPGYKIEVRADAHNGLTTGFVGPAGFSALPMHPTTYPTQSAPFIGDPSASGSITPRFTGPSYEGSPGKRAPAEGPPVAPTPSSTAATAAASVGASSARVGTSNELAAQASWLPKYGMKPRPATNHRPAGGASVMANKRIEFDQAINYVNKIKTRFSHNDDVYKKFLDILYTYQREQKTIKEVYEQVETLFRDQPDLLDEFTHFLPDTGPQQKDRGLASRRTVGPSKEAARSTGPAPRKSLPSGQKKKPSGNSRWTGPGAPPDSTPVPVGSAAQALADDQIQSLSPSAREELKFFSQVRDSIGPGQQHMYSEFIKCLALFSQEIISKSELVFLAEELFGRVPSLYKAFSAFLDGASSGRAAELAILALKDQTAGNTHHAKQLIGGVAEFAKPFPVHEDADAESSSAASSSSNPLVGAFDIRDAARTSKNPIWQTRAISEIAGESTVTGTASYKRLPLDFSLPLCSGRNDLEQRTLNDVWVSVPMGSEDYSTKHLRKNPYEDNLFRCEDDRYELDMVIETNASTIQKLEPIAATIAKLTSEDKKRYALAHGALGAVHFRAIERIYGETGAEIVDQVRINPSVAVPVVLTRLKQKDEQWRKARLEMNKIWREVCEKNFYRALDHRSFVFKQTDKKELNIKSLRDDIHDPVASAAAKEQILSSARGYGSDETTTTGSLLGGNVPNSLELRISDGKGHEDAAALLKFALEWECSNVVDAAKTSLAFKNLFTSFYKSSSETSDTARAVHYGFQPMTAEPSSGKAKDMAIMYGDESIYILFRLEHILSERLTSARHMATEQARERQRAKKHNEIGFSRTQHLKTPASNITQSLASLDKGETVVGSMAITDAEVLFEKFIEALHQLLTGVIDTQKYEDTCRYLLGTNCYILFTMDRLVAKFTKQVQSVFGSTSSAELTSWLLQLHEHERRRPLGFVEELYHGAAAAKLAQDSSGSFLYRIQVRGPANVGCSSLWIYLLGQGAGQKDGISHVAESFTGFSIDPRQERVKNSMPADDPKSELPAEPSKRRALFSAKSSRLLRRLERSKLLDKCVVINRLECKMSSSSERLFFVDGTADLFFRPVLRKGRGGDSTKSASFRAWLTQNCTLTDDATKSVRLTLSTTEPDPKSRMEIESDKNDESSSKSPAEAQGSKPDENTSGNAAKDEVGHDKSDNDQQTGQTRESQVPDPKLDPKPMDIQR